MSPTSYKVMEVSAGTRAGVAAGFEDYGFDLGCVGVCFFGKYELRASKLGAEK